MWTRRSLIIVASYELLAIAALFVVRFDMHPVGPAATWKIPPATRTQAVEGIMHPDHDIEVSLTSRSGYDDREWIMTLSGTRTAARGNTNGGDRLER